MLEVDRYALARYADVATKMRAAYERFDFQTIFHELNRLTVVDLSAFYFDVSKDRLYTFGAASKARRSAQTAIYLMADGLARLLAPILPVTADELWRVLPPVHRSHGEGGGSREASVHVALFPEGVEAWRDEALVARYATRLELRDAVNAKLEEQRQAKVIGTSLEAAVTLAGTGRFAEALAGLSADEIAAFCIVSEASVVAPAADQPEDSLVVSVVRVGGDKCQRCWRYVPTTSTATESEGLCDRCIDALGLAGAVTA
jgi:isoleucyl-tRNA synthetase